MNLIENRAAELRAAFIQDAIEFGFSPDEIAAATGDDDGEDYFLREAENEARRALAASRIHNRRAICAATPRYPATRRAPRRTARKKAATASGTNDGDGPRWSYETIDHFFSGLMPICRIDKATGQKGISVVKLFSSVNSISMSDAAWFLSHYLSNYIAASGVLEFEEAIELFRASNVVLNNHMA